MGGNGRLKFTLRSMLAAVAVIGVALFALDWYWKLQAVSAAEADYERAQAHYDAELNVDAVLLVAASEKWMSAALQVPLANKESIQQAHLARLRHIEKRAEGLVLFSMFSTEQGMKDAEAIWLAVQKAREDAESQYNEDFRNENE